MSQPTEVIPLPGEFGQQTLNMPHTENIPRHLHAANGRLQFPPSYIIVGVYRLVTDRNLRVPAWKKCEHGVVRGACVGAVWAAATFKIQKFIFETFLVKSTRFTGLSRNTIFGFAMPFDIPTCATILLLSSQVSAILAYFLSRNIRIARERAYEQTILSRGKGAEFWGPYVEEWDVPPVVKPRQGIGYFVTSLPGKIAIKVGTMFVVYLIPVIGLPARAWFRALGTSTHLHKPYFKAKGMTPAQIALFIEERKWDYRAFGFAAALLESIPVMGLVFTVSNRIGAAMWAHDLEKRQHYVAQLKSRKE